MQRFLLLLLLLPLPVLAGPTELQKADMVIPYACGLTGVTVPLVVNGDVATAQLAGNIYQNSGSDYTLSSVDIHAPTGVNPPHLSAQIEIVDAAGSPMVVSQRATASNGKGKGLLTTPKGLAKKTGLANEQAVTKFTLITDQPEFVAGQYSLRANFTCSQSLQ